MSTASLTPAKLRDAERLQRHGLLLREIAVELGVEFEAVCLGLYGGNVPVPPPDRVRDNRLAGGVATNSHAKATKAEPAPGTQSEPPPDWVASRPSRGGGSSAAIPTALSAIDRDLEEQEQIEVGQAEPVVPLPLAAPPDEAAIDDEREDLARRFHPATRFNLRSADGQWLHESLHVLTRMPKFFWRGTAEQVAAMKRRRPQWRSLEPVPTK